MSRRCGKTIALEALCREVGIEGGTVVRITPTPSSGHTMSYDGDPRWLYHYLFSKETDWEVVRLPQPEEEC